MNITNRDLENAAELLRGLGISDEKMHQAVRLIAAGLASEREFMAHRVVHNLLKLVENE